MITGNMGLGFILLLALTLFSLYGCNEEVKLVSQWRTEPISIDGDISEWPDSGSYLIQDSTLLISVLNDASHIYIRLLTKDHDMQSSILRDGLSIWIDEAGNNEKKGGICFPVAEEHNNNDDGHMRPGEPKDNISEQSPLQRVNTEKDYSLAILKGDVGGHHRQVVSTSEAAQMGIRAHLGVKLNFLIYELQLPFSSSSQEHTISIGFESGGPQNNPYMGHPPTGQMARGGPGGPPPDGPPMGGGGIPPNGGPPAKDRQESLQLWATVTLMDKPAKPSQPL